MASVTAVMAVGMVVVMGVAVAEVAATDRHIVSADSAVIPAFAGMTAESALTRFAYLGRRFADMQRQSA